MTAKPVTRPLGVKDPLEFGFSLKLDQRLLMLARKGWFNQHGPRRLLIATWSLTKVLTLLESPEFMVAPDVNHLFLKALFLLGMALGVRVSQIHALTVFPCQERVRISSLATS